MKNQNFFWRLWFAFRGIGFAWVSESSFRFQSICALFVLALLVYVRPQPMWWALCLGAVGAVLSAELFNTAMERLIDNVFREVDPDIAKVKDCAAGAVLVLSFAAVAVFFAFLFHQFL